MILHWPQLLMIVGQAFAAGVGSVIAYQAMDKTGDADLVLPLGIVSAIAIVLFNLLLSAGGFY